MRSKKPEVVAETDLRSDRGRRRDRATRERLYAICLPVLRRWARRRFANCGIHDADDLVQIALLRTLQRLDWIDVRGSGGLLAYLRRIVVNEVRSEWRRQVRLGEQAVADELPSDNHDPVFDAVLSRERDRTWTDALSRLSGHQRAHLSLRVEHGMSFAEIARETGSSTDAARMVVARAARALNAQLAAA
jgi:RNA polymerase sigma-70 factor (ECF subfamily)